MRRYEIRMLLPAIMALAVFAAGSVSAEEITIVGTGSGEIILQTVGTAFSEVNPGVTVSVPPSIGSGGGIKAVGTDQAVIGRVAREIKEKEKPYELTYLPFAGLPIVFFVNKNVSVQDLSPQQVCDIYGGKITNWQEVGGENAQIRVVRREEGDSSLDVLLKSLPGFKDIIITPQCKTTLSDPETCALVMEKDNTIAFGTYANAKAVNAKVLSIGGASPTRPDYPYIGTLAFVFKEKNKIGIIARFLDFATSEASREKIKAAGGLPL